MKLHRKIVEKKPVIKAKGIKANHLARTTEVKPLLDVNRFLASADWPVSVNKDLMCLNKSDKIEKAVSVMDWVVTVPVAGKKFLDFGCGEGFVVKEAAKRKAQVSGYEVDKNFVDNEVIFDDFEIIKKNGPYDIILVYDVLDHLVGLNVPAVLSMIHEVAHDETRIFVTTHPLSSRHGSHLYEQTNKAFSHLFSSVITPGWFKDMGFYQRHFVNANFKIENQLIRSDYVEPYFVKKPVLREHLDNIAKCIGCDLARLIWKMRCSFFDFSLKIGNDKPVPYPVAQLRHTVNETDNFYHTFYSNGKIGSAHSNDEWFVRNRHLSLRWPRNDAPGGVWLDECTLSEDFQSYQGANQNGMRVYGDLI